MSNRPLSATFRTVVRNFAINILRLYYVHIWGMDIGKGCIISFKARLDKTHPQGVHIGKDSTIAFGSAILAHDFVRGIYTDTRIGERCYIGAHSIILAGVEIGDGTIIAAGSVVMRSIPAGCIAYGNPARVLEKGIITGRYGKLISRESDGGTAVDR
jgi:acetyltransferase-like isoleucine patch superfamily enzyme